MFVSTLLLGLVLAAEPAVTADADLEIQVGRLVRQLGASQLEQREAAEKNLTAMGPRILSVLPGPSDDTPEEVRQRLGRVRQKLEKEVAEATAKPGLVTLPPKAMQLSKILSAIQTQTGNKAVVDVRTTENDPEIKVEFRDTPFWTALDTALDSAKMSAYPFAQDGSIRVVARSETQLPRIGRAAYSGPFRVEPVRLVARRDLRSTANPNLSLSVEVAWEPRLRPISIIQQLAELTAVDDNGRAILPGARAGAIEAAARGASAVEIDLPLAFPDRPAKEIASLKGTLRAVLPGAIETFVFKDLLKAKKTATRKAGAVVTLEDVRKSGQKTWEVRMGLRFDKPGIALESHRNWILQNEAYLQGPDGKPIPFESAETTRRSDAEIGMAYTFTLDKLPENLTFVYKTPGTIVTAEFPYELKGIKLP
jgi:hypothetical protein